MEQQPEFNDRWIQRQRQKHKTMQLCEQRNTTPLVHKRWEHGVQIDDTPEDQRLKCKGPRKRAATGDGISAGIALICPSSPPRRSDGRTCSSAFYSSSDVHFNRRPRPLLKQLWTEDEIFEFWSTIKHTRTVSIQAQRSDVQALENPPFHTASTCKGTKLAGADLLPSQDHSFRQETFEIIIQPETRPISQERLVAEVKGKYAGLVMVEAKCIEVDNKQAALAQADSTSQPKLNNEQWQALIALHRTLLHVHHDFFLASQHSSASPALRQLAARYAMPARMWRHGIHSFLELLRHRIPASLDHKLAFIYLAYPMMALLYETVPAFEDTWNDFICDLGRHKTAIEADDLPDREIWTVVARHWYSRDSDRASTTGRLYYHLAILARPNALQPLSCYSKSLSVEVPSRSGRESILALLLFVADNDSGQFRVLSVDSVFAKVHGHLFPNRSIELWKPTVDEFLHISDKEHSRNTRKIRESGNFHMPEVDQRPFPEEPVMRGLLWNKTYFPVSWFWFAEEMIDKKDKYDQVYYMPANRPSQISWAIHQLALITDWAVTAGFTALQSNTFRYFALIAHTCKLFPVTIASVVNKTNSTATGTNPIDEHSGKGLSQYFKHLWHQLKDETSGPIIENTAVAAVLSSSYFLITYLNEGPRSRDPILPLSSPSVSESWLQDLLPVATALISIYTLYLGNGNLESDWQLAMLATHNVCLSIKFIQQKLSKFPKTQKPAEFILTTISLSSSGLLTKFFAIDEGRYKNPLIQAAMFLPLMNLFLTVFWIRFVRNYGVAKALEEGDLIAALRAFWERRSYPIIAVVLIVCLLAKI